MTVRVEVPTGREVREHIEAWRALPEGERPVRPVELWSPPDGRWLPWTLDLVKPTDDDTPQPGLRLVPLPTPVGDGWRRPVDEAEAMAARVAEVLQRDYPPAPSQPTGWGRCGWDVRQIAGMGTKGFRVPSSWEPGRERVRVGHHRGRTIGGKPIYGINPVPSPPRLVLDDPGASMVVATVIAGTAWVWVDPIEAPEPEPWVPQAGDLVRYERYERRSLPKRVVHVHEGWAWVDEEGAEWWHRIVPLSSLHPWTERDGE